MNADFAEQWRERLSAPLPGAAARAAHAPQLSYGRHNGPPPADARRAAEETGVSFELFTYH